jgi:Flp pilus assembly protein TadD
MKNIILFFLLLPATVQAQVQQSHQDYLQSASQVFAQGDYEQALTMLQQAQEVADTVEAQAVTQNALGWTYHNLGQDEKARQHLFESLQKAVEIGDMALAQKASNNIGVIEFVQGNLQEAVQHFSSPWAHDSPTAQKFLRDIAQEQRQKDLARLIADGVLHRLNGDFTEALALYDQALTLDPQDLRALEFKGYALYRMQNFVEAEEVLQKAYALDPQQMGVVVNLLKVYCASERTQAAQDFFAQHQEFFLSRQETLKNDGELRRVCAQALPQELRFK